MKKRKVALMCAIILCSYSFTPLVVSATNPLNDPNNTVLDEESYAILQNSGIDSEMLEQLLNSRGFAGSEYVIAFYSSTVENTMSARLSVEPYYSSNLSPYLYYDAMNNKYSSFAWHNGGNSMIGNQQTATCGTGHTLTYTADVAYPLLTSDQWIFCGLFTQTTAGSITLGRRPDATTTFKPYSPTNYLLFYTEKDNNNNPVTTVPGEYYYDTPSVSYEVAMLGDINDDGIIDIKDAVLEARIENNDPTLSLTRKQYLAADVNVDLSYDALDTNLLMRYLSHTVTSLFSEGVFYDDVRTNGGVQNHE